MTVKINKPLLAALEAGQYTPKVYKAFSYELTASNQSGDTAARVSRFATWFDTLDNQYLLMGQAFVAAFPGAWVKIDQNNNLIWTRAVTGGQSTLDRPFPVTQIFTDPTNTYYYLLGSSALANAQGYSKLMVSKWNISTHANVWNKSYTILTQNNDSGRRAPWAAYDSTTDTIYSTAPHQYGTTSTSYFGLHKIDGATGNLLLSKTSGNGNAGNAGNNDPVVTTAIFGSYIYIATFSATNILVAKYNKSDFSLVWIKGDFNRATLGAGYGPSMNVDIYGNVFVAANLSSSQTIIYKVSAAGTSMNYITVTTPSYNSMTAAKCLIGVQSIDVDEQDNVYLTYGYHNSLDTSTASNMIIGKISFNGAQWSWLKAVDIIREDTGAVIGVSDGWSVNYYKGLVYINGVCDVTTSGLTVDNNNEWQTLNLKIDKNAGLLTNGSHVGTFSANRRSIKMNDIAQTAITASTFAGQNTTLLTTLVDTGATTATATWTQTAVSTDYVNRYN